MTLREYEKLFKALSDKQRLRILALLSRGPLVVNDIKTVLHLSMSTVSQHLSILRDADLLMDNKQGRWVIYSIHPHVLSREGLPASIYAQLKALFDEDESLIYDLNILQKLERPAVHLPERPYDPS